MDEKRIKNYNASITDWVLKQGVFFQLFNSFRLLGGNEVAVTYLLRILFRLVIFVVLVSAAVFYFLATSFQRENFSREVSRKAQKSLAAEKVSIGKLQGGFFAPVNIRKAKFTGSESSFFDELLLADIKMDTGWDLGFKKNYQVEKLYCSKLDVVAKVRPELEAVSAETYSALFSQKGWFTFRDLAVKSFSCKWGYTENTKGAISRSNLKMKRDGEVWELNLTGGTFNYGWLRDLKIESMLILFSKDKFEIKEAKFSNEGTSFSLDLEVVKFGMNPEVSGKGSIRNCPTDYLLREEYTSRVRGVVNSDFTVHGLLGEPAGLDYTFVSSNSEGGTNVKFNVSIPIWRALSIADNSVNYRYYNFDKTRWEVEVAGGEISVRDVFLENSANDDVKVALNFNIVKKSLGRSLGERSAEPGVTPFGAGADVELHDVLEGKGEVLLHDGAFIKRSGLQAKYPSNNGVRTVKINMDAPIEAVTQFDANVMQEITSKDFRRQK